MMSPSFKVTSPLKNTLSGFSLLEVLITLVILAIGLLGLAGLQATGLKNNLSAYHRSQATQLSYEIADKMRSNLSAISTYATLNPTSAVAKPACKAVAGICSDTDMAQNDLFEWNSKISTTLPSGAGLITQATSSYTISITWDDDRDGDNTNNINFRTSIQP
mgnify:FL=1